VRSQGNRSTEWRLRSSLMRSRVRGWRLHATELPGKPDVVFDDLRVAVFVDGCFWHRCPSCKRRLPTANRGYWKRKIDGNVLRASDVQRALQRLGFAVVRFWEHELRAHGGPDAIADRICLLLAERMDDGSHPTRFP